MNRRTYRSSTEVVPAAGLTGDSSLIHQTTGTKGEHGMNSKTGKVLIPILTYQERPVCYFRQGFGAIPGSP